MTTKIFTVVLICLLSGPLYGREYINGVPQDGGGGDDNQMASEVPFVPNGSIESNNVQDAVVEVRDEAGGGASAIWASGTDYTADTDYVINDGHLFICTSTHTSATDTEPGTGASWTTVWKYSGEAAASAEMTIHEAAADPHPGYRLESELLSSADVSTEDAGGYFTGTDSEAVQQEIGAALFGNAIMVDLVALTDPGADRIPFWDYSAGDVVWLTVGSGLTITGTEITAGGSFTYPGAGIPLSTGSAWGTSYSLSSLAAALDDESWTATGTWDLSGATVTFGLTATDLPTTGTWDASGLTITFDSTNALDTDITYETLYINGDIGTGSEQVASGDHNHSGTYEPADATILKDADIGSTIQAYNSALSGLIQSDDCSGETPTAGILCFEY